MKISNINVNDQYLTFLDEQNTQLIPTSIFVADAYLGDDGSPVILREYKADINNIDLNLSRASKDYDLVLVVDATYNKLPQPDLCVAFSVIILWEDLEKRYAKRVMQPAHVFSLPVNSNPERFSIWDLIRRFIASDLYAENKKYAIITDTDLSDLYKINRREIPIWDLNFLPANFDLIFARDKADVYLNSTIRVCDKFASLVWEKEYDFRITNGLALKMNESYYVNFKDIENQFENYQGQSVLKKT